MKTVRVTTIFALLTLTTVQSLDQTLQKYAYDTPVVLAALRKIEDTCIFPNDYQFMKRVAWVESAFGETIAKNNWWDKEPQGLGGIWQVDNGTFIDIRKQLNSHIKNQLTAKLNVDLNLLNRDKGDLQIPLYGAVVSRSEIYRFSAPIPIDLNQQAAYWKKYYNTVNGTGTEQDFLDRVKNIPSVCSARGADLLFILDSSASIGSDTFQNVRDFVATVVSGLPIAQDRYQVAIDDFSSVDQVNSIVQFNQHLTQAQLLDAIKKIPYYEGDTAMGTALRHALSNSFGNNSGVRREDAGFPRIAVLITDGVANGPVDPIPAAKALKDFGVTLFTIGVGSGTDEQQLKQMASNPNCIYYYSLNDYVTLAKNFPAIMMSRSCETVASAPSNGDKIDTSVQQDQSLFFRFNANITQGITFKLSMTTGQCIIYASKSARLPTAANYDFTATATVGNLGQIYFSPNDLKMNASARALNRMMSDFDAGNSTGTTVTVFASITGVSSINNFTLQFDDGDQRVSEQKPQAGNGSGNQSSFFSISLLILALYFIAF